MSYPSISGAKLIQFCWHRKKQCTIRKPWLFLLVPSIEEYGPTILVVNPPSLIQSVVVEMSSFSSNNKNNNVYEYETEKNEIKLIKFFLSRKQLVYLGFPTLL